MSVPAAVKVGATWQISIPGFHGAVEFGAKVDAIADGWIHFTEVDSEQQLPFHDRAFYIREEQVIWLD